MADKENLPEEMHPGKSAIISVNGENVGLIGRVDPNEGIWLQIDPSRTHPIALAKELTDIYDIPCHIDNDVKSATRAEQAWGFGQII